MQSQLRNVALYLAVIQFFFFTTWIVYVADLGGENAAGIQALWIALLVIWIASSSVLRAPPVVLLMKYAAKPQVPRLAALILLGLALGGAISPYFESDFPAPIASKTVAKNIEMPPTTTR
jgi:hypothetical protein